jgi:tetratricopeptide (TPR) repeat protein
MLHRKYLRAIESLGAGFETLSMPDRAIRCYERALELDPKAERLHQKLWSSTREMQGASRR